MKAKKRWRYYCDYCKKSGGSAHYIKKHEKGCTANPNRICGYCETSGNAQVGIKELADVLRAFAELCHLNPGDDNDWSPAIDALKEATNNCPACILAAIRQSKLFGHNESQFQEFHLYDFKKESRAFWSKINDDRLAKELPEYG